MALSKLLAYRCARALDAVGAWQCAAVGALMITKDMLELVQQVFTLLDPSPKQSWQVIRQTDVQPFAMSYV